MCGTVTITQVYSPSSTSPTPDLSGHVPPSSPRRSAIVLLPNPGGPDWSGIITTLHHVLCHERLAIVGIDSGAQPLTNGDESVVLTVNGEIYNHLALRKMLKGKYEFKTHSDCEVLLYLVRYTSEATLTSRRLGTGLITIPLTKESIYYSYNNIILKKN